jgi:hypothetical protein
MTTPISPFLLLAACTFGVAGQAQPQADDQPKSAVVKKKAQELGEALKKADYPRFVDLTYPKVVELTGGREKMIAELEAGMKQMKEQGYSFRSVEVGEPGAFLAEGSNTFVVLPTTTEMAAPGGKVVIKSHLLGISPDGGKAWTFIDVHDLGNAEKRERVLPRLPEQLELPKAQEPKFIKDE